MTSHKPQGYHRLASVMSKDNSIAIFRRFDEVNILNLLSLQAEIFDLQNQFHLECSLDDQSSDSSKREYSKYLLSLHQSKGKDGHQYELLLTLRERMNEYNDLLLKAALSKIPKPKKSQLAILRGWLCDSKGGDCFQKGSEVRLWEDKDDSVFLTLNSPSGETDLFTGWVTSLIVGIFHRIWGEKRKLGKIVDEESGLMSYDDSKVNAASMVFATIISSTLPVITILVLYLIKNTIKRIFITLAFTATFAGVLATCSSARRVEIFAATATFAAVEVVFIGSAISS